MPKYVVVSNHLPNTGPSSNKMIKESNKTLQAGFQPLMQKLKIKPEVLLRFDPGHKVH
ncbi:MAG TPA: hypothetical protein VK126_05285 [Nitrososphaerales archaeon]|nr:hypothetical protein [Nitrososphaerales archaeon]